MASDANRNLILKLQDSAKKLTPSAHSKDAAPITESNQLALNLCEALEMVFIHGMKIREFNGNLPLWGLLERLEIMTPPCIPLRNTVGAVACISSLRSPMAKGRAWIRQILNAGCLEEALAFITAQSNLLKSFYYPNALLCTLQESKMLAAVVRSFKILQFNLKVDEVSLNAVPVWLARYIQAAMGYNSSSNNSSSNSSASGNTMRAPTAAGSSSSGWGGFGALGKFALSGSSNSGAATGSNNNSGGESRFDSFMKSFETGLDKLLVHVDAAADAATKYISERMREGDEIDGKGILGGSSSSGGGGGISSSGVSLRVPIASGPMIPFYGSSLRDLLLDERRSSCAYLNPTLGVPNLALKLISFIAKSATTPDLFRQRASLQSVNDLRRYLESTAVSGCVAAENTPPLPSTADVASVCFVLIQWLNQLPEPLLGFEHYEAVLACQDMEQEDHRIRNLSLLVSEAPWYSKPLLFKIMQLLHTCTRPENTTHNNLNLIAVSVLSTPFLLRPYSAALNAPGRYRDPDEVDRVHMAATAAGSTTIEFLITNYQTVMQTAADDLAAKQNILSAKTARIRSIQRAMPESVNTVFPETLDDEQQQLIRSLWQLLAEAEKLASVDAVPTTVVDSAASSNPSTSSIAAATSATSADSASAEATEEIAILELLSHPRWDKCGFEPAELPLKDFNAQYGLLALRCLVGFLKRYKEKGASLVVEFSQNRSKYCTLSQIVIRMAHFAVEVLQLLPTPTTPQSAVGNQRKSTLSIPSSLTDSSNSSSDSQQPTATTATDSSSSAAAAVAATSETAAASRSEFLQLQLLARKSVWSLLNDEQALQEAFDMAMLSFDDAWRISTERIGELPHRDTAAQCLLAARNTLWAIILQQQQPQQQQQQLAPRTVDQMWELWMQRRVAEQQQWAEKAAAKQQPVRITAHKVEQQQQQQHQQPGNRQPAFSTAPQQQQQRMQQQQQQAMRSAFTLGDEDDDEDDCEDGEKKEDFINSNNSNSNDVARAEAAAEMAAALQIDPLSTHKHGAVSEALNHDPLHSPLLPQQQHHNSSNNHNSNSNHSSSDSISSGTHNHSAAAEEFIQTGSVRGAFGGSSILKYESESYSALDQLAAQKAAATQSEHGSDAVSKTLSGITTHVFGGSCILSERHIQQLEAALPKTHQCYDWNLKYRLSVHGANIGTLLNNAKNCANSLLVLRDSNGAVFGALITEQLKATGEREKYYGNGTIGVWSFVTGALKYYSWSFKNSYFLLSSTESIALGGGGNFAIYLDGDLNRGSSGDCQTFNSPCLASESEFVCHSCELFSLTASLGV